MEPFIGEIRMFAGNFAPRGNALCDGQLLSTSQNEALFSLLGTVYGGDGRTSFALPDLRSRTPMHVDHQGGKSAGQKGGAETVTLTAAENGAHTHTVKVTSDAGTLSTPSGTPILASADIYRDPEAGSMTALRSGTVTDTGGGQAHKNMQPFLTLNFCIALKGLFPSRN